MLFHTLFFLNKRNLRAAIDDIEKTLYDSKKYEGV